MLTFRYNQVPLFSGKNFTDVEVNADLFKEDWIWNHARNLGYITLFAEERCNEESVRRFMAGNNAQRDKWKEHVDHSFVDLFCDPKMKDPEQEGSIWKHGPSCLGG